MRFGTVQEAFVADLGFYWDPLEASVLDMRQGLTNERADPLRSVPFAPHPVVRLPFTLVLLRNHDSQQLEPPLRSLRGVKYACL